ncbi:MAG: response regulator transcription factor [Trueperaceae bacterium]|nr:response regulator transcription factor [Trueperaceae bacterium]
MSRTILIVEDDPDVVRVARAYLEREGYAVLVESDGDAGLRQARATRPDLVVLDWMLPNASGLDVLRRLRADGDTPVLMLTARTEEADRVLGLELGADDYLTKPFSPRELVARVGAVLRRTAASAATAEVVRHGLLEVDGDARIARVEGRDVDLTTLEFDLLWAFAAAPGRVFRRDELIERVWGGAYDGNDRVVDVHVSNLRQKLADAGGTDLIRTVRGVGYALR